MDAEPPKVNYRRQQLVPPQPQPRLIPAQNRPVSLYDNLNGASSTSQQQSSLIRGGTSSVGNLNAIVQPAAAGVGGGRVPSLATCLVTTVPQNMAAKGFAGRHTPTRSSLRHSRMVVLGRDGGRVPRKYQPGVLRPRRLGTALCAVVCLLGALVTAVAGWFVYWAPSLPPRDIPLYSGPLLLFGGLTGLVLLGCCRKDYPGRPYSCLMFSFKVANVSVTALASLAALCSAAFAVLHVSFLWISDCQSVDAVANSTCTCEPTFKDPSWPPWPTTHVYPDLSCPEVESILGLLLVGSGAANLLGGLLAGWYVLLHWRSRYATVYAKVPKAPPPVVISNVSKA